MTMIIATADEPLVFRALVDAAAAAHSLAKSVNVPAPHKLAAHKLDDLHFRLSHPKPAPRRNHMRDGLSFRYFAQMPEGLPGYHVFPKGVRSDWSRVATMRQSRYSDCWIVSLAVQGPADAAFPSLDDATAFLMKWIADAKEKQTAKEAAERARWAR